MKRNSLSPRDLREVRFELERERDRFAADDPRRETYVRALARLADGRYGICEGCTAAISPARLLAIPEASRCLACTSRITTQRRFHQLTM
jgi:RNA polymerase-binding transcription factor DksA